MNFPYCKYWEINNVASRSRKDYMIFATFRKELMEMLRWRKECQTDIFRLTSFSIKSYSTSLLETISLVLKVHVFWALLHTTKFYFHKDVSACFRKQKHLWQFALLHFFIILSAMTFSTDHLQDFDVIVPDSKQIEMMHRKYSDLQWSVRVT